MSHTTLNFTESKTEWLKFGQVNSVCFVGREYVCFGGGCHLLFVHIGTKKEVIYEASNNENGDGIDCTTGLLQSPVVAFSDKKSNATVFVMTCPEFRRIASMTDGTRDGYVSMTFTEAEFLITLTGLPSYALVVWNWRNGEKIATKETDVLVDHQLLRSSFGSPVFLAQVGVGTNRLNTWDILMCGKRCLIIQHAIVPLEDAGVYNSVQWMPDGGLFVLNERGDVYTVSADYKLELVFTCKQTGSCHSYFVWYKAGLTIAGPDGVLKHYKKGGNWKTDWEVRTTTAMSRLLTNQKDLLIGITESKEVMLYNAADNSFEYVKPRECQFDSFCLIYPIGDYIVTLGRNYELTAWRISTGLMVDFMNVTGKALCIKESPEYPYFAVAFVHGSVQLFSFCADEKIKPLATFNLTHGPMTDVKFFETGKLIVAADLTRGQFFFIEGFPGAKMHVLTTVSADRQIADYILVASKTCLRLFAIPVTSDKFIAGDIILRFCLIKNKPCPDVKEYQLENPGVLYSKLYTVTTFNRDRLFYAMPVESKSLHELETQRGDSHARLVGKIKTGHHMRKIMFHFDKHHTVSFGYDGIVTTNSRQYFHRALVMSHHRKEAGVIKAYVDPLGKYIVSLGRDNVLVCTNLTTIEVDKAKQEQLRNALTKNTVTYMFTHPTIGFVPTGRFANKTWVEVQELLKIDGERHKCEAERESILASINEIKRQVQELLTRNLEGPENELLDVQEFNLDSELKDDLTRDCQSECKSVKLYLEASIVARNKVSKWIKQFCWDTMQSPGKSLFSIFGIHEVENYVLLPDHLEQQEVLQYIIEHRMIEDIMARGEAFKPWNPLTTSKLTLLLSVAPTMDEKRKSTTHVDDDDDDEADYAEKMKGEKNNIENTTALVGSVKHLFITPESGHYSQYEIQTHLQIEYQMVLSSVENIKLKLFFNKEFEFLKTLKVREILNAVEKNARLRHILSELNYFSKNLVHITVEDPVWVQKENPELILKVTDEEVSVCMYISPSQQAILDAEAAERERLRLLMLADDFKERALMAMMNGVLEIRWEDELRKDVPKPKCMIEKKPQDYREDDLKAIRDYENQVVLLQNEREKYKRMLTAEYANTGGALRESVKKFNMRLQNTLLLKIKVESAVCQENFKINRFRLRTLRRARADEAEKEIQKEIASNDLQIEEMQKLISSMHENLQECRSLMDTVQVKEKALEKACRRDFLETSQGCQEVVQKLYRKRPKMNLRAVTSVTMLIELSKCVVSRERVLILNHDALEYLRAVDKLDQYGGVPNALDEARFFILCKHRRLKVECELRGKAAAMQTAECEHTIAAVHRYLVQKKEHAQDLSSDLSLIRTNKIREAHDFELQLVMREGLVEQWTSGEIGEFSEAILISRKDVEEINKVIYRVGEKKLKAMRDAMNFRRGILAMEWEHRKMRMTIRDKLDYIADIRAIKVTKETQSYLMSKARGDVPERQLSFEQEVDIVKQSYARVIADRKIAVADLEAKMALVWKDNSAVDKLIREVNVDVCAQNLEVDLTINEKEKRMMRLRTATLLKRARLVREIQENHNMILMLQTELEILRLKTFPTLKYKIIN